MKRIYLIDCPGVVPANENSTDEDILLRGVVRVENVSNPEQYVAAVLGKCEPRHIRRTYEIDSYSDATKATDFLEQLARKSGRLLKGGEADVTGVAKQVLNDFLRGKIPWFTPPPAREGQLSNADEAEGGRLGDMARLNKVPTADLRNRKRNRTFEDETVDDVAGDSPHSADGDGVEETGSDVEFSDEEFEAFTDSESEGGTSLKDLESPKEQIELVT